MLFGNYSFFSNVTDIYPLNAKNSFFLVSLAITFSCAAILLLSLACFKYTIKPILIIVLIASAASSYFMDTYNVIISDEMIDNVVQTNFKEAVDLITIKFILYLILLGVIPSVFVYKQKLAFFSLKRALFSRVKLFIIAVMIMVVTILSLGTHYTSFIREHKVLRYYSNPSFYIYSLGKYLGRSFKGKVGPLKKIALDAKIPVSDDRRKIVVLVVGEAARADRFSLNGYQRETNPLLKNEALYNFKNFSSCGTSTAYSVPCMFSMQGRSDFDISSASNTENLLDILKRAGVNVIWLDNNSDSKGVARRITYKSYSSKKVNPVCDPECRDVGMLSEIPQYIAQNPKGDILIVMHQMGNHGPAYYKRYPSDFEKFKPTCKTNQIEKCSDDEIKNTYDNVILYTDYFLSRTIQMLKKYNENFDTSLIYASDHGESLGEGGLYLHGLPYFMAPTEQTHIPAIMWFSESFKSKILQSSSLALNIDKQYSHDNIFHTILGIFNVITDVYKKELDLTKQ